MLPNVSSVHVIIYLSYQERLTADDITFVGQPLVTDDGLVLVAFFAEYPDGKVVDGNQLADVIEDNRNEISVAVSSIVVHFLLYPLDFPN